MASRANVMTGLLEYRTGCNFMHGPMIDSIWQQSYPVALRRAGYYTGFGGKFGFAVVKDVETPGSENRYEMTCPWTILMCGSAVLAKPLIRPAKIDV